MAGLPAVGTRVALRYRLPEGSVPPLTDVVGHLLQTVPLLRVQTKTGVVVDIAPDDVVAVRALTAAPVRTSQIRATEHAAALAWPGLEQQWLNGWLLRAADGHTHRANSAVPLGMQADRRALPAIVDWYARRDQTPWLAVADRLLPLPDDIGVHIDTVVMIRDITTVTAPSPPDADVTLASRPDERWLRLYRREVPVDVLTAVIDGEVVFGTLDETGVGRAAVTTVPDGTRWAGLSAVRIAEERRRRGHARTVCTALLGWAAERGATRCYAQVLADNAGALALYDQLGFAAQHRARYIDARSL